LPVGFKLDRPEIGERDMMILSSDFEIVGIRERTEPLSSLRSSGAFSQIERKFPTTLDGRGVGVLSKTACLDFGVECN
jgi:hypothetical protein